MIGLKKIQKKSKNEVDNRFIQCYNTIRKEKEDKKMKNLTIDTLRNIFKDAEKKYLDALKNNDKEAAAVNFRLMSETNAELLERAY